ncbi:MAG: nucleoside deaminase, partial [Elusimicrobiota bacterium]|nr:nucleoside deaminase [Elusimicrobiota bacterium]
MKEALKEARKAERKDEVPIGAIIVDNLTKKILSRGHNQPIKKLDPTAHAEIVAIRAAAKKLKNYRLNNCSIYVTVEPCAMCAGAIINARIKEIFFGANDPKSGATKNLN